MLRKNYISVSPPISASSFGGWNPPASLLDQGFFTRTLQDRCVRAHICSIPLHRELTATSSRPCANSRFKSSQTVGNKNSQSLRGGEGHEETQSRVSEPGDKQHHTEAFCFPLPHQAVQRESGCTGSGAPATAILTSPHVG